PGACYLRAVRADLPLLYSPEEAFPLGGHKLVRRARNDRAAVILVGSGYMVHSCLAAADRLDKQGLAVAVVDAYALPLDTDQLMSWAGGIGAPILTVEDNYAGGIGSELAEAAAQSTVHRVQTLVVRDIPKSGRTADDVLAYVHLSVDEIVA